MNFKLGTLNIIPWKTKTELISPTVIAAIDSLPGTEEVGIAEIDPELSDTAEFCEHYKINLSQAANCVVLEAKRADRSWLAACVVPGNARADVNGLARRTLNARKVSFALMDEAVKKSQMEYGAITPVGLPEVWPILIDKAVVDSEIIIIGSGLRKSKLAVPGKFLSRLPNATVLAGLAK